MIMSAGRVSSKVSALSTQSPTIRAPLTLCRPGFASILIRCTAPVLTMLLSSQAMAQTACSGPASSAWRQSTMAAPAEAAVPAQSFANASPAASDASALSLAPAGTTVTFPPPVLDPQQPVGPLVAEPPSTPSTGDQSQQPPPTVQQPIAPQPPPTAQQPVVGSGSTPVVTPDSIPATGEFAVKDGKIYAADGQQFETKGINVFPGQVKQPRSSRHSRGSMRCGSRPHLALTPAQSTPWCRA